MFADLVNLQNVGVLDARDGLGLGADAFQVLRTGAAPAADHFQGHHAVQLLLPGLVHDAHAACAEFAQDLVARRQPGERAPGTFRGQRGEGQRRGGARGTGRRAGLHRVVEGRQGTSPQPDGRKKGWDMRGSRHVRRRSSRQRRIGTCRSGVGGRRFVLPLPMGAEHVAEGRLGEGEAAHVVLDVGCRGGGVAAAQLRFHQREQQGPTVVLICRRVVLEVSLDRRPLAALQGLLEALHAGQGLGGESGIRRNLQGARRIACHELVPRAAITPACDPLSLRVRQNISLCSPRRPIARMRAGTKRPARRLRFHQADLDLWRRWWFHSPQPLPQGVWGERKPYELPDNRWEHVCNLLQVGKLQTCRHNAVRRL